MNTLADLLTIARREDLMSGYDLPKGEAGPAEKAVVEAYQLGYAAGLLKWNELTSERKETNERATDNQ